MKLFSPAKLNLFFVVLGQREDGFHEVASLMQAISLGDIITFTESERELLSTSNPVLPCDETNFIMRALKLFQRKTRYLQPFHIHVEKQIPIEGGLGGGSGNVATTLWALNRLSGLSIEEDVLREWAEEISSDAPFFFSSGTAFIRGRGDLVEDVTPLQLRSLWIAQPEGGGVSTSLVYKHYRSNSHSQAYFHSVDPYFVLERQIFFNELEATVFELRPDLAQLKEKLIEIGFHKVVMTGSGSSFFCLGDIKPSLLGVKFTETTCISRSYGWYAI